MLQWLLGYNFSVAVWVGYIALFGIAVETAWSWWSISTQLWTNGWRQGRDHRGSDPSTPRSKAPFSGLRPKLMTVIAVLASLVPILFETGVGSDVMKPIAAADRRWDDHLNHSRLDPRSRVFSCS